MVSKKLGLATLMIDHHAILLLPSAYHNTNYYTYLLIITTNKLSYIFMGLFDFLEF